MGHIVVYLQRTTRGLHPGSLAALCVARDVADTRGGSVMAACRGDAGAFDDRVVIEASRAGADQLVFVGPEGIQKLTNRLQPRQVFAPATAEADSVLSQAGIGPLVGRWIAARPTTADPALAVGIIAGTLPWHNCPLQVEPEYEADVGRVELPEWLVRATERATDLTTTHEPAPLVYLDPAGQSAPIDADTRAALTSLGAYAVTEASLATLVEATVIWLGAAELPGALLERNPGVRVMLLVGNRQNTGPIEPSWGLADYVLAGPPAQVLRDIAAPAWKTALV